MRLCTTGQGADSILISMPIFLAPFCSRAAACSVSLKPASVPMVIGRIGSLTWASSALAFSRS